MRHRVKEEDEFIFEPAPIEDDDYNVEDEDWDEIGWEYGDDMPEGADDAAVDDDDVKE